MFWKDTKYRLWTAVRTASTACKFALYSNICRQCDVNMCLKNKFNLNIVCNKELWSVFRHHYNSPFINIKRQVCLLWLSFVYWVELFIQKTVSSVCELISFECLFNGKLQILTYYTHVTAHLSDFYPGTYLQTLSRQIYVLYILFWCRITSFSIKTRFVMN